MVQPLRDSRDHYEELKQIDDAMTEVKPFSSHLVDLKNRGQFHLHCMLKINGTNMEYIMADSLYRLLRRKKQ